MTPIRRLLLVAVVTAVVAAQAAIAAEGGALRLIGVRTVPHRAVAGGMVVGGLSGLDYDAAADRWLAVSDDRADNSPARFFTVRLDYDALAFTSAEITAATELRQPDGSAYPNREGYAAVPRGVVPDLESLRLDPRDGLVWYTSEGDQRLGMNSFVRQAARDGSFRGELALPAMFSFDPAGKVGPRSNLTLEGLTFSPDGASVWLSLEAPLLQDGPVPTATTGAVVRFTHLSREGTMLGQFGYPVDAWQLAPAAGLRAENGVSEILALPDGGLLVLERSGADSGDNAWRFTARLYVADFSSATNVAALPVLAGAKFQPAAKQLVFDFAKSGVMPVDNIEGLAWGRRLSNGHATLVAVSDDNFTPRQQTQFWVFEVTGPFPAAAAKRNWDEPFEGVVHDDRKIGGFVGAYRWLSNFHLCRVEWEGRVYGSSEAAYQSGKYPPAERDVFTTLEPDAAKKLSRSKPYDTAAWEARKERTMREVVWAKFSQNPDLAAKLAATGDRLLEETNWWGDEIWGVYQGRGQNLLGRLLMETRARLAKGAAKP